MIAPSIQCRPRKCMRGGVWGWNLIQRNGVWEELYPPTGSHLRRSSRGTKPLPPDWKASCRNADIITAISFPRPQPQAAHPRLEAERGEKLLGFLRRTAIRRERVVLRQRDDQVADDGGGIDDDVLGQLVDRVGEIVVVAHRLARDGRVEGERPHAGELIGRVVAAE